MARDARETKMHYSPSEKDGVFVVEVARGADSTGVCNGKINTDNFVNKEEIRPNSTKKIARDDGTRLNMNEEIQVHQPPIISDELLTIDEDGAVSVSSPKLNGDDSMRPICGSSNTGLSQSDLSISSSCGSNQGYCYGSQQHYTVDTRGYQSSSPHVVNDIPKINHSPSPPPPPSHTSSKPIITAAIYKQESVDPGTSYPEDGRPAKLRTDKNASTTVPLIPAVQTITQNGEPHKEDVLIEEQHQLGNGVLMVIEENTDEKQPPEIVPLSSAKLDDSKIPSDTIIECIAAETNGQFDSLINLPEPPTIDEIKQLNDTLLDNNNMDSLPPPPPPEVVVDGPLNGES